MAAPPFAEANLDIRIADAAFTQSMSGHCPGKRLAGNARKPKELIFWMRLEAGEAALEAMRKSGRLPITHKWWASIPGRPYLDGTENLPATEAVANDLSGLYNENRTKRSFDWRTQTKKRRTFSNSFYKVEILDARGEPIPCAKHLQCLPCKNNVPCAIRLTVR